MHKKSLMYCSWGMHILHKIEKKNKRNPIENKFIQNLAQFASISSLQKLTLRLTQLTTPLLYVRIGLVLILRTILNWCECVFCTDVVGVDATDFESKHLL